MNDGARPSRYPAGTASGAGWTRALALLILLASSVFSGCDDLCTSAMVGFTGDDGLRVWIDISSCVSFPLDEEEATLIMEESPCPCQGDLELQGDFWQHEEPGCAIYINVDTGDVECFSG